jgi:hypothetical protein
VGWQGRIRASEPWARRDALNIARWVADCYGMRELRGTAITTLSGTIGLVVGAGVAVVISRGFADAQFSGIRFNTTALLVLGLAGFVMGPAITLRIAGYRLAEVTAALATIWVLLLFMALGPTLDAIGPAWSPLALFVAALAIARLIAEPFSHYLPEEEPEPVPAPVPVPARTVDPAWSPGR